MLGQSRRRQTEERVAPRKTKWNHNMMLLHRCTLRAHELAARLHWWLFMAYMSLVQLLQSTTMHLRLAGRALGGFRGVLPCTCARAPQERHCDHVILDSLVGIHIILTLYTR